MHSPPFPRNRTLFCPENGKRRRLLRTQRLYSHLQPPPSRCGKRSQARGSQADQGAPRAGRMDGLQRLRHHGAPGLSQHGQNAQSSRAGRERRKKEDHSDTFRRILTQAAERRQAELQARTTKESSRSLGSIFNFSGSPAHDSHFCHLVCERLAKAPFGNSVRTRRSQVARQAGT